MVDENFLETTFDEYYIPTEIQDITLPTLPDGRKNAIAALYSDEGLTEFDEKDSKHVISNTDDFIE